MFFFSGAENVERVLVTVIQGAVEYPDPIAQKTCFIILSKLVELWGKMIFFFLRFYLFSSRERGREGGKEEKKHQCVVASHMPPTRDLFHKLGVCPRRGIELVTLWFAG